jgi:hypothetical protein
VYFLAAGCQFQSREGRRRRDVRWTAVGVVYPRRAIGLDEGAVDGRVGLGADKGRAQRGRGRRGRGLEVPRLLLRRIARLAPLYAFDPGEDSGVDGVPGQDGAFADLPVDVFVASGGHGPWSRDGEEEDGGGADGPYRRVCCRSRRHVVDVGLSILEVVDVPGAKMMRVLW